MDFLELLVKNVESKVQWENAETDERFYDEFIDKALLEEYIEMLEFRKNLPAYKHKDEILEAIEKHQVVLIEGNTGCGKTTQVAQYILDEALINQNGSKTRILCTQPRRIAGELLSRFNRKFWFLNST